jgi:hypothetical protein
MHLTDPAMILAFAALVSSVANLIWAVRRGPSAGEAPLDQRGRAY